MSLAFIAGCGSAGTLRSRTGGDESDAGGGAEAGTGGGGSGGGGEARDTRAGRQGQDGGEAGGHDAALAVDVNGAGGAGGGEPSHDAAVDPRTPGDGAASDGGSVAGPPRCQGAGLAVCEDFEATAVGALPTGWARRGGGYGGKSLAVAADDAARGTHALKIEGGTNGSQFLEYRGALGPLATAHWGRIFFKVKVPAPWPASGVLHGDIVQHIGPHPGGGSNGVRWGIVENPQMKFQWIYNVQPSQGENEFGEGTAYTYSWPGRWQCLEWHYDQPSQSGAAWLDGVQLPLTPGKSHAAEIPVFTSLGVGWANYQNAPAPGFVVWIDEVAFDAARISCDR